MSSEAASRSGTETVRTPEASSSYLENLKRDVSRRHRRIVAILVPAALLELTAALIACIPGLADAGTRHTWHLVTAGIVSVVLTGLACWRTRSLEAGRAVYVFATLLAALLCAELGRWSWLLVRAGASARNDTMATVCAGAATLMLAVVTAQAPHASWLVADAVTPLNPGEWYRVLVTVVALLLVALATGVATDSLAVDATTSETPERNAQLPVSGVAWRTSTPGDNSNVIASRLGPALLSDGLHVLDGATGRELWHRSRRFVQYDRSSVDGLTASPDGGHLAVVETSSPVAGDSTSSVTVLTDRGRLVRTIADATDVALTNDAVVTASDKTVTARDWKGYVRWVRPLDDGCGRVWTMTTGSVLISDGCEDTRLLTQVDDAGSTLAQVESQGYEDPLMVHAPDFSSTMLNTDRFRPPGAASDRWFRPTLMLDDHGRREVSVCRSKGATEVESCVPGTKGSVWVTRVSGMTETLTVLAASGHTTSHTGVPQGCRLEPLIAGTVRLCDGGDSVQLPGSPAVALPRDEDGLRTLWPAGGAWIVVTPGASRTADVIALR